MIAIALDELGTERIEAGCAGRRAVLGRGGDPRATRAVIGYILGHFTPSSLSAENRMTQRTKIATPDAPQAIGPYSQAIVAGGLVHCSGQIAFDPTTMTIVAGDVSAQTERVLQNLTAVLKAAGTDLSKVVKCTVFLKSMNDFTAMNAVYGKHFSGDTPPARSTVEVARLPKDVLVEIDCMALLGK